MISPKGSPTKRIIALDIDLIMYKDAIAKIVSSGRDRKSSYVCFANVHMVIEAHESKEFENQVNNAMLVLADGVPLVKVLGLHGIKQERIAGMDAMPSLFEAAESNHLKIFFFGTTSELLEKISAKVKEEFPNIDIAGMLSPPFNKSLDEPSYIRAINDSGAHLVFVALGCPKQEKWMAKHSYEINAVLLGVGGAFPVYAGIAKRAPGWMRSSGLEWLYRLYQEPGRLFKRYFKTNTKFIYLTLKNWIKNPSS